ncbi:UDP-N-acetylglucosamine--N-acetylmuramyl-(pentapeptide) pyrophosphoryl-undecaprenol N-acetylglucosamine transferase [Alphaproteobacteria bacterium]|nr:UDP-N-acetylglucosamine--N-acetylmuramyl-(pentapeptide) pyrophosphoryl-undecaprenol N-acetylglucosamine transferase [Alphaproteobacteria bacterium]
MRILCVGGGSGGHVTPVVAITSAIRAQRPDAEIRFITDKRFLAQARDLFGPLDVPVSTVLAGKLRRYANLRWYDHIQHFFISYIPNFFDLFKIALGVCQSWFKLLAFRPDVIFIKGGYVGLPVGLAAALLWPHRPIVLHDSDVHPGLTNRILSRYAVRIGTGMPTKYYDYPKSKVQYVGIPVTADIAPLSVAGKRAVRGELGLDEDEPMVLVAGGSQGSRTINQAILAAYPSIKGHADVLLVTGQKNYADVVATVKEHPRNFIKLRIVEYLAQGQMNVAEKAADLVIARAGATTLAELAMLGKPTIIVPSPYLAADHQTKNAEIFAEANAAIVLSEDDLSNLATEILRVLDDKKLQTELSENIKKLARPDAAERMAEMILEVGDGKAR